MVERISGCRNGDTPSSLRVQVCRQTQALERVLCIVCSCDPERRSRTHRSFLSTPSIHQSGQNWLRTSHERLVCEMRSGWSLHFQCRLASNSAGHSTASNRDACPSQRWCRNGRIVWLDGSCCPCSIAPDEFDRLRKLDVEKVYLVRDLLDVILVAIDPLDEQRQLRAVARKVPPVALGNPD